MKSRTDTALLILTAVFVAGLAIVAGAISFAHMRELATAHDQTEWKSYAFPISVDGLEIVASLYLVAQRRAGRPTGPIPWIALIVGTAASLAANVAVGGADPIGKALAGWPAISMLVSIKLLFAMIDHHTKDDQQTVVRDDQRTSPTVPDVPATVSDVPSPVRQTGRDDRDDKLRSGTVPAEPTNTATASATDPAKTDPADRAQIDIGTVARLIPAARAARATLGRDGRSLSRDSLAEAMRDNGHAVANQRASLLLKILKAEQRMTTIDPTSVHPVRRSWT